MGVSGMRANTSYPHQRSFSLASLRSTKTAERGSEMSRSTHNDASIRSLSRGPISIESLNPRQQRLLQRLLLGPASREEVDRIAGASNGPGVVSGLRTRGLVIPCKRSKSMDSDGRVCWPGAYRLNVADKKIVRALFFKKERSNVKG